MTGAVGLRSDPPSKCRVAVIGAGAAGLTAAYRLLQLGHAVTVFEAAPTTGGLLRTFEVGGEPVECFYHHLFTTDSAAVRLLDELGLGERLEWFPSRVGLYHDERLWPFTTALDLLRFSALSVADRVRLGRMALRLRRERDASRFEEVTAAACARREVGARAYRVVWEPLLRGKFGDKAEEVGMAWLWNKVHLRFSSRRGPLGGHEVLGYLRGSFAGWTDALAMRMREMGGMIRTKTPVERVTEREGELRIEPAAGEAEAFDALIATVANEAFIAIAPGLPEGYAGKLRATEYQDAVCLVLVLRERLTPYYWLNVNDRTMPFVAVVEHTNLVGTERYEGRHIVYVADYVERGRPAADASALLAAYMPHLRLINPAFDESLVEDCRLFVGRDAQPVFTAGAGARVPEMRTPVPGLYLANMGQIYPEDRGQNQAIMLGERVAGMVGEDLAGCT